MLRILEGASKYLESYYKTIPAGQLSERIQLSFKAFDTNGDGRMDKKELQQALAEMGHRPTDDELEILFKNFDLDGSGKVDSVKLPVLSSSTDLMRMYVCRACA